MELAINLPLRSNLAALDNEQKDAELRRMGFLLGEHWIGPEPCAKCGYDRRYHCRPHRCLWCEATNP